ncbi:MAG: PilN domain-containing protein, partial [Candidatus Methylomirabilales bacterium]
VSRVLLSGGGTRPRNLAAYLAYNLEIPVELLNPFGALPHASSLDTAGLGGVATHFVPAVGAALGDVGINLIPPEIAARNRMALARFGCRAVVVGLVTGLAILHTSYQAEISQLEGEIAERRQIVQRVLPLLTELEQWEQVAKDAGPELAAADGLRTTHFLKLAAYKALSQLTPEYVTLRGLKLQHSSLKVVGLVFAEQEEAEGRLARYLDILSSSPFFRSVRLVSSLEATNYATRAVTFEVELTWSEPWASPAAK